MKSTNKRINLDWNKLMGFNQVASAQSGAGKKVARAAIGAKVGAKVGTKGGGGGGV
jgi:hypothetical protein